MPLNDEQYSNCSSLLEYYGNHWGWVYAREAVPSSIAFDFQQLHLAELVAFTAIANLRSRAAMERLGMRLDSEFEHPHVACESGLRTIHSRPIGARAFQWRNDSWLIPPPTNSICRDEGAPRM